MPLEYQRGSLFVRGKRQKFWYGKFRVWCKDAASGEFVTRHRTVKLGPKSSMTKFQAEQKLRDIIAEENEHALAHPQDIAPKDLTLSWFVENRHLPMLACRETTKKKTAYEIRR